MADITISKTAGAGSPVSYTIRNICTLDIELCTIVADFPIPETGAECNIIVKAEGNRLTFRVAWTIIDEPTSVVSGSCVSTVSEQVTFLIETFEAKSIEDAFSINIGDLQTKVVFPNKLTLSKSASTPITYVATYELISGDIVASETT